MSLKEVFDTIIERLNGGASVRAVYGEPVEAQGKTIIPVAKVMYGFYYGPVAETSMFHGKGLIRHGWVVCEDGTLVDPTRWVFEDVDPYIYAINVKDSTADYDPGMRSVRQSPCNEADALDFIDAYLDGERFFEVEYLRDLANTFPEDMPGLAGEVYDYIAALGYKGLIPIDFWNEVN